MSEQGDDLSKRDKVLRPEGGVAMAEAMATRASMPSADRRLSRLSVSKDYFVQVAAAVAHVPAASEFYLTFGFLGVPMVVAFVVSALTLLYMALVQVFPTQVANLLMNTSDLDNGDFWLLVDPPIALVVVSTLMLVVFGCCYLALVLFMVFFREYAVRHVGDGRPATTERVQPRELKPPRRTETCSALPAADRSRSFKRLKSLYRLREFANVSRRQISSLSLWDSFRAHKSADAEPSKLAGVLREVLHPHGKYHAYYNALHDLPKLIFQTAALFLYLQEGFPLPLTYFYLAMLMTNWLISFYRFQRHSVDRDFIITRLFYLFDLFFAVFAPIVVLVYAYEQFDMDRAEFATRVETLSPGFYDRIARLFADPVQIDVFRYGFMHLQFTKVWYVAAKIFLNALVIYKWKKIITFLVIQREVRKLQSERSTSGGIVPKQARDVTKATQKRKQSIAQSVKRAHSKKRHLFLGICVFLACMVTIFTYVFVAISKSTTNCLNVPECRVISYHLTLGGDSGDCPCIVYINRDQAPRTWRDWINATDVTRSLALAAKSGHLKTIQIINRAVPELPMELSRCVEMEQLILVYSRTQTLPDWVEDFYEMHYIHIEADYIHYPLRAFPLDIFKHMSKLRFLRIGGAAAMPQLPSLFGLHSLTSLVLSIPHSLHEFPSFDDLAKLSTLIIGDATHVTKLPSLQPLKNLKTFSLFRRNEMCCNGFITGVCDLTDYQCLPRPNEPVVVCETARMSDEDHRLLASINAFVCSANLTSDVSDSEPTQMSTDGVCGGVLYKQCHLNGREGICYNGRMHVIRCDIFGEYIAMRRLQIARRVGPRCDANVEAWLGC